MIVVAAAAASYNDSSGVFENSSGVFDNSSAVFDALPLPSDATHDDAPVPATYAASDELIKLMKAKPNHVDAMRHLLGTAVNKTSDDGGGRRRASDGPKFAHDDGVRLQALTVLQELVEDLDKAEDFRRAGGFEPLLELLDTCCLTSSELRIAEEVAWILGTAAQNQRSLQLHFHEREALLPLARLVIEDASEVEGGEAAKAKFMFAISALTRNCPECQALCEDADCLEAIDAALAEGPRVAAKALVLLTDLLHESLAAKAAEASGRPTYDGHLHSARPAQMFWESDGGIETQLCWSVLGHFVERRNGKAQPAGDLEEKALLALMHMHAASILDATTSIAITPAWWEEAHGAKEDGELCGRVAVPRVVRARIKACESGESDAGWCADTLPLLRSFAQSLGDGRPSSQTFASSTAFHWQIGVRGEQG